MYRVTLFAALSAALVLVSAESASARGKGGSCCCTTYYVPCPPPPPVCYTHKHKGEKKKKEVAEAPAAATLVVTLPADARLTIDEAPTTSTTATRVFQTPALQPGSDYTYTLKAEVVRNGEVVPVERQVTVRAGEDTHINLTFPVAATAAR